MGGGQVDLVGEPAYLGAQLVGAVLASLALWGAYGSRARSEAGLGAPAPNAGAGTLQVFAMEALIGFALAAGVLVAGPVSGGAANPVRALGPMIVDLRFPSVLAYCLAPILGGVIAAVVYQRLIGPISAPDDE